MRIIPVILLLGSVSGLLPPTIRPPVIKWNHRNNISQLAESASSSVSRDEGGQYPSWKDIIEAPISIATRQEWDAQPQSKRIGMTIRASVLHLTLLSSLAPLMIRGALLGQTTTPIRPGLALAWTICMMSWHAAHNMVNDLQDLETDDAEEESFRASYGVHVLKQGFMNRNQFLRLVALVAAPGVLLSTYFHFFQSTVLASAFPFGLAALVLYTPIFKPLAMGELLVYMVWGPLMAGYGNVAAGAPLSAASILSSPISILFGSLAFQMIMGKHTDKIPWSNTRTMPKLLGPKLAIPLCYAALAVPYAILTYCLTRSPASVSRLPLGSALAFLALGREAKWTIRALRLGLPTDGPTILEEELVGTVGNARPKERWPLWFVQFLGWHCITFGYLAMVGSGLEWGIRALMARFL